MPFVVDGSVAVSWFFEDETTPETEALRDALADDTELAPDHWALEVANALVVGFRRGRMVAEDLGMAVDLLRALPIELDAETSVHAWSATLELALRHHLSVYDAAYLELALRTGLALATLDSALAKAAARERVRLIGPLARRR